MSTITWPEGESQTYVLVENGQVRVDGDHADTGQRTAVYDVPEARARAAAHRALADAMDTAADHILSTRISGAYATLERLIDSHNRLGDAEAITTQVAKVRALLDGATVEDELPPAEPLPVIA